ncbi:MAG: PAS domain S-box protein [Candidatus Marinimicrobia bacterium]|nr:PAS domain S-box protein [Candidatus Neomarinimicrobiota bacterium]
MKNKQSILKFFKSNLLVFTIFITLPLVGFEFYLQIHSFRRQSKEIRREQTAYQKELVKSQVESVVERVRKEKDNLESEARFKLDEVTRSLLGMADFLVRNNPAGADGKNNQQWIIEPLQRFMENFDEVDCCILNHSGVSVVKMSEKRELNFYNSRFSEFAGQNKEGFYSYTFFQKGQPDTIEKYLQLVPLKPLNWTFCVSMDKSSMERRLQEDLLEEIGKIRYGRRDVGYIFVVTYDGVTLMNDTQRHLIGLNIWDYSDPNGVKVIQEERRAVENPDGGFIEYSWKKPGTDVVIPKISFLKGIQDWQWMIGAGSYLEDIEKMIALRQERLRRDLLGIMLAYLGFLACFVTFINFGFRKLNHRIGKDLALLTEFLENVVRDQKPVDRSRIRYREFDEISDFANKMLAEKILLLEELEADKEKITDSEKKYYALFVNAPLNYQSLDEKGYFLDVNPMWLRTLGYDREEVIGKWFGDFLDPDFVPHFEKNFPGFKAAGCISGVQFKMRHKTGKLIHVEFEGSIGYHSDGTFKQTYCVFKDITYAIEAEKALKQKTEQYELAVKGSNDGIWDWNIITNELFLSRQWKNQLGYIDDELPNLFSSFEDHIYQEDKEFVRGKIADYLSRKTDSWDIEFRMVHKSGQPVWIRARGEALWDEKGTPYRMAGSHTDMTERKAREKQLQVSEEKFRLAFETSPDSININRLKDGLYININQGFTDIMGYTPEEVIGKSSIELDIWKNPEDRKRLVRGLLEKGYVENLEAAFVARDGSIRYGLMSANVLTIDGEDVIISITRDITERIEMEHKLQESYEKYELLFNTMSEGFALHEIICDNDGNPVDYRFIDVNSSFEKLTGLQKTDIVGKRVLDILPGTEKYWIEQYGRVALGGQAVNFENFSRELNRYYSVSVYSPEKYKFAVIITDVTRQKQMERELTESEQKYRSLIETLPDITYIYNSKTGANFWSSQVERILGYNRHEIEKNPSLWFESVHPDDKAKMKEVWEKAQKGEGYQMEYRMKDTKGLWHWFNDRSMEIQKDPDNIIIQGIATDITQEKYNADKILETTKEYLKLSHELETILDNLPAFIYYRDTEGKFLRVNRKVAETHHLTKAEVRGKSLYDLYSKEVADRALKFDREIIETKTPQYFIEENVVIAGQNIWTSTSKIPFFNTRGEVVGVIGISMDITALKKATQKLAESEENLSNFFNTSIDFHWVLDEEGNILNVNNTVVERLKYDLAEILGRPVLDFHPRERVEEVAAIVSEMLAGTIDSCSMPLQAKSGDLIPVETYIMKGVWNNRPAIFGISRDVSELKFSEEKFAKMFQINPVIMGLSAVESGQYIEVNQAFYDILGYGPEEVIGKSSREILKYDENSLRNIKNKFLEKGSVKNEETIIYTKNGDPRNFLLSAEILELNGQQFNFTSALDITSSKAATQKLLESEARFNDMLGCIPDMVSVHDLDFNILYSNWDGFASVDPEKRKVNTKCYKTYRGYSDLCPDCRAKEVLQTRKMYKSEAKLPDGTWIDMRVFPLFNGAGDMYGFVEWVRDITDRKQSEEEIIKLSTAIEQSPTIIAITDLMGNIEYVNDSFCRITGYEKEEVIGQNPRLLKSGNQEKEVYEDLWKNISQNRIWTGEFQNRKKNGELYWESVIVSAVFDKNGAKTNYLKVAEDITLMKQMKKEKDDFERQYMASQKLETVGTLAGGIAHDFNNILTPILGYSGMIKKVLSKDDRIYEEIDEIYNAGMRAKDLISQILNFSRQTETHKIPMDPYLIVNEVIKLMRPVIPAMVDIKTNIRKDCQKVWMDGTKIHQVMVNLMTNAAQAIGGGNGRIEITLKDVIPDQEDLLRTLENLQPRYCKLTISDNGCGISQEVISKIFDPFFTTKEQGQGTGLGLSVVHGIITEHKGFVFVDSEVGKRTTFTLYLPSMVEDHEQKSGLINQEIIGGDESVLLIDDRIDVTKMTSRMLTDLGYRVHAFNSPFDALQFFKQNSNTIDIILTDYAMPKMSGMDLAEQIKSVRPEIPVIIATGNAAIMDQQRLEALKICKIINKPLLLFEISRTIRELLNHNNGKVNDESTRN